MYKIKYLRAMISLTDILEVVPRIFLLLTIQRNQKENSLNIEKIVVIYGRTMFLVKKYKNLN